jgi:catecholate siderophore receptor
LLKESGLVTSLLLAAGAVSGQTPAKPAEEAKPAADPSELPDVVVEGKQDNLYKPEALQSPKFTAPLRDTPQTVTVIPKTVIEDRGAFSLRDVLRNSPGISMQAGEGGGGLPGDNLSIRGFNSRSDFFIDGVRDSGSYNRDPFNLEQVEVTKGPSSANGGRGSPGGSINVVSKAANLERNHIANITGGTDELVRTTIDANEPLSDHMAFRLNLMYHTGDTPGRDVVTQERFGIAGSLAFGLGTDTRFFLNYQHLTEDNIPDYGIPWVPLTSTPVGSTLPPVLQPYENGVPPVSFDNFYGRRSVDYEHVQMDMVTGILEHDFSDDVRLRNVTRYGRTVRDSVITAPRFFDTAPGGGSPGNQYSTTVNRQLQRREMTNEIITNLTNVSIDFDTGPLKHSIATGMEIYVERQLSANASRNPGTAAAGPLVPGDRTDVFSPNPNDPPSPLPPLPGAAEAHLDTVAFYLFDTIRIGEKFQINGGVRYDHIQGEVRLPNGLRGYSNNDDIVSGRIGVVYKPLPNGSIYAGYGTSASPSLDAGVSGVGGGLTGTTVTPITQAALDPEKTQSYEVGTKWDVFDERLSLTAAIFRVEKTDARTTDPVTTITTLGGAQEVNGIELGIAGSITNDWQIFGGYSYMESEVTDSAVATQIGNPVNGVPDHSFNIWTTYNLPRRIQVGFGAQYVGERTNSLEATARTAPGFWTMDAMVSWQINDSLGLRLNIYNLADERYIDRVGGGHFVPGAGRSAALTATLKF